MFTNLDVQTLDLEFEEHLLLGLVVPASSCYYRSVVSTCPCSLRRVGNSIGLVLSSSHFVLRVLRSSSSARMVFAMVSMRQGLGVPSGGTIL